MVDADAPKSAPKAAKSTPRFTEALTIFVCDPSVEAERVSQALREASHHVVDVPLSMLVARVAVQRPRVILVDADAEGAIETIGRMRELPDTDAIDVLFFGRTGAALSTSEDALAHEGSGFFPRPVEAFAVLKKLHALIEGEESGRPEAKEVEPDEPPPPMSSGRPQAPMAPNSVAPKSQPPPSLKSSPPPSLSTADLRQSPPPSIGRVSLRSGLSEELEHLLAAAEARVGGQQGSSDIPPPSPEEELDAVLPESILAALDTPLDDAEEDQEADASASPGTTSSRGTTSRGRAAREPAREEPPRNEAPVTNDGVPVHETQGERIDAPSTGQTSSARGTEAGSVGTALRTSGESRPETSAQSAFGVPPSPPAPLTPFSRRRPSSMPPPNVGPQSALSSTMGSEVLVQAGAMLLPMNPAPPFGAQSYAAQPQSMQQPPRSMQLQQAQVPQSPVAPPPSAHAEVPVAGATILGPGDAARFLAHSIATRQSGAVTFESDEGMRRVVLREGDVVTAASGVESESLLAFLGARGELPRERLEQLSGRLPPYGRHAGAALVAQGALRQDQLWTVLRSHAEWLMGQAIAVVRGRAFLDPEPPGRLRSEPSVFGGSTGAEVLVEVVRRTASEQEAIDGLGGVATVLAEGPAEALLTECGLGAAELDAIQSTRGERVDAIVARFPQTDVAQVLYALTMLGVVTAVRALESRSPRPSSTSDTGGDALDDEALRARIRARVELVEEGDYFAVMGVPRTATSYEIRRAFVSLRRTFDPSRLLTPSLLDLADDVRKIVMVLEEAYEILGDSARRERYRRAIEDVPQPQAN